MKKYRALVPILLIVVMVASWYMLISKAQETEVNYKNYLNSARQYAGDGIEKYAMHYYELALSLKSSPELYKEIADYYKNKNQKDEYFEWCERLLDAYPKEPLGYECLMETYLENRDYNSCYNIISTVQSRKINSSYISRVAEEIKYYYRIDTKRYDEIGAYGGGLFAVRSSEYWGFLDMYGNARVSTKYVAVGGFAQGGVAPVVDQAGDAYFIDVNGDKIVVSKEKYAEFGSRTGNIIVAKKTNGKYIYVDAAFNPLSGEYDYASTMNEGVAAVKVGEDWSLISQGGGKVGSDVYVDVKMDAGYIACRNERIFVSKTPGKYILVDKSGNRVGNLEFEDAHPFMGVEYAAVKISGKWKFINKSGALISDKAYDDARSFSNGFAAVRIDGKWGFVDLAENVVIEPKFNDALYFSERGSCFVKESNKWQLLIIYRLNRGG